MLPPMTDEGREQYEEYVSWFDKQSKDRIRVAAERAMKAGDWSEIPDEDSPLAPSFVEDLDDQLMLMMVSDTMDSLVEKGVVTRSVGEDGEFYHEVTSKGWEMIG